MQRGCGSLGYPAWRFRVPIWKIRGSSEWCRCRTEDGEWRGRRRGVVALLGVRLVVLVVVVVVVADGRRR